MKVCRRCHTEKPRSEFRARPLSRSRDGLDGWCKACHAADQKSRYHGNIERGRSINRASTARRIDAKRAEDRQYAAAHKVEKRAYDVSYRAQNGDKIAARVSKWKKQNRARINAATNHKRRTDPATRLALSIGVQMRNALRGGKPGAWRDLVGYTVADLRSHLESLFRPGMSWENYGAVWHIDHKRPVSTFSLPAEIRECWALSNLQPLTGPDNMSKGARWNGHDPRRNPRRRS